MNITTAATLQRLHLSLSYPFRFSLDEPKTAPPSSPSNSHHVNRRLRPIYVTGRPATAAPSSPRAAAAPPPPLTAGRHRRHWWSVRLLLQPPLRHCRLRPRRPSLLPLALALLLPRHRCWLLLGSGFAIATAVSGTSFLAAVVAGCHATDRRRLWC